MTSLKGYLCAAAASRTLKHFPTTTSGSQSAELTGNLDTVLNQLADYIERDVERAPLLNLIYPGVVACMSVGVVIVLTAFVMPLCGLPIFACQAAPSDPNAVGGSG